MSSRISIYQFCTHVPTYNVFMAPLLSNFHFCFINILFTFHLHAPRDFFCFLYSHAFPFFSFSSSPPTLLIPDQYRFFPKSNSCPIFKSVHSDSLTHVSNSLPRRFPSFFHRGPAHPQAQARLISESLYLFTFPTAAILQKS